MTCPSAKSYSLYFKMFDQSAFWFHFVPKCLMNLKYSTFLNPLITSLQFMKSFDHHIVVLFYSFFFNADWQVSRHEIKAHCSRFNFTLPCACRWWEWHVLILNQLLLYSLHLSLSSTELWAGDSWSFKFSPSRNLMITRVNVIKSYIAPKLLVRAIHLGKLMFHIFKIDFNQKEFAIPIRHIGTKRVLCFL